MVKIYTFRENDITISAEKDTLIALAQQLRRADIEGTWSDLCFQIEYEFNIDGVREDDDFYNDLLMEQREQM